MTEIEEAVRLVEVALALIDKELEGHPDPVLVLVPRERSWTSLGQIWKA